MSSFSPKCLEDVVDSRNWVKYSERVFTFLDKYILIGYCKFSLLRRKYLSTALKVLTKYLKGYKIANRDIFRVSFNQSDEKYDKSAVKQI